MIYYKISYEELLEKINKLNNKEEIRKGVVLLDTFCADPKKYIYEKDANQNAKKGNLKISLLSKDAKISEYATIKFRNYLDFNNFSPEVEIIIAERKKDVYAEKEKENTKEKKELHKDIPLHNVYSYGALYDRDNTKLCCNPASNATYDFTIILDTNKLSDDEFSILRFLLEYFAIRDKHKMLYVSLTHSIISKILDKKFDKNQSEQIISSLFKSEIFNLSLFISSNDGRKKKIKVFTSVDMFTNEAITIFANPQLVNFWVSKIPKLKIKFISLSSKDMLKKMKNFNISL